MCPTPTSTDEARLAWEAIRRLDAGATETLWSIGRDSRRIVGSWFRNQPDELGAIVALDAARETCKSLLRPVRGGGKVRREAVVPAAME